MKNIENIKDINKITLSYMLLKGLFGERLEHDNPFFTYILNNVDEDDIKKHKDKQNNIILFNDINDINKNINPIENKLFHNIISETYNMYKRIYNVENIAECIDENTRNDISNYLDNESEFIGDIIDEFNYYLIDVLINFKSQNKIYNNIKIEILTNEMNCAVDIEDYDCAIYYRDIINDTKKKIKKTVE